MKHPKPARDVELEWWLVELGVKNRDLYRRVRAVAWDLVVENHEQESFIKQNNAS